MSLCHDIGEGKPVTTNTQLLDAERQSFAQVTDRLNFALTRDRRIRLCKAALVAIATGATGAAAATLLAPGSMIPWAFGSAAFGALASGIVLWRQAPDLLDMARRADRHAASDKAVETSVENWQKDRPLNDVTRLLQARVIAAVEGISPQALSPAHIGWPLAAAIVGIALGIGAQFLHAPPQALPPRAALQDNLETLATLVDSEDAAIAALAQEAEALIAALAQGADPAEISAALEQLQSRAADVLAETTLDESDMAAVADALQQMTARAEGGEAAPPPEDALTHAGDDPGWGNMDDMQTQNIDAPQNDMVTMPTRSDESAIEDNTLECEFGDEATCSVRADGELPPMQNQYDEDIPEQMGRDELTQGGDPGQSRSGTGDAGATGTTEAALTGTAEQGPALEAAFSTDTLTLSADNPISEGRRSQGDMTTTFEGGPVTRFPDAPEVGQADWRRAVEEPVARAPLDPALSQVLRNYYPAPEDWR